MSLYLFGAVPLKGSFWIRVVFPFGHRFGYLSFLYTFIPFRKKCVVYGGDFLKPKSVYAIKASGFLVCYLFKCCLELVGVYAHLRAFFEHSQLCFQVVYLFGFFVMIFPFPCFAVLSILFGLVSISF